MESPLVTCLHAIRVRLMRLGLSERKFATLLGISQPTLNARLNGYRRVPAGFEAQCAEALDVWEQAERAATEAREKVLAGRRTTRVGAWPPHAARRARRTTDGSASVRH